MDPNVLGGVAGGIIEGTLGLAAGIVGTVFAYRIATKKNGSIDKCSGGNGHCSDHKDLVKDVKKTSVIVARMDGKLDVLVDGYRKNGNGRSRKN